MIVGGYVLHLYCDGERCARVRVTQGEPIAQGEFTGNTGGEARRAARGAGWKLDELNDKAWCRKCRKEST